MSKYTSLIAALEASTESFNAVCKAHGHVPATAYNVIGRVRPDLLKPRSDRLGFSRIPGEAHSDDVISLAVERCLSGDPVKSVAADLGLPIPTLYRYLQRARAAKTPDKAPDNVSATATDSSIPQPTEAETLAATLRLLAASSGKSVKTLWDEVHNLL